MIRINLLPHKKVKPVEKGVMRLWIAAIAVAVLLLGGIAVFYVMLASQISDLNDKKEAAQTEYKDLQTQLKQVSDFETKRKDFENKLAIIGQIQKTKIPLTPVLFELNKLVVKDVWIDKLVIKDASIQIDLKALKRESIAPFFDTFQKSKTFSNLTLDSAEAFSPKLANSKAFPFTIKGKIAGYEEMKRPTAQEKAPKKAQGNKGKKAAKKK